MWCLNMYTQDKTTHPRLAAAILIGLGDCPVAQHESSDQIRCGVTRPSVGKAYRSRATGERSLGLTCETLPTAIQGLHEALGRRIDYLTATKHRKTETPFAH
jgi:hypothetical protein